MTLSTTFDTFEAIIGDGGDIAVLDADRAEPIVTASIVGDGGPVENARPEPRLAAAPFFIEFDEPAQLDPDRAGLVWELPSVASRTIRFSSPLASLLFHLLPLLALIIWPLLMVEPPSPIPVQLVFEPPPQPAPPPPQPQPAPKPPQLENALAGPRSSVDQGLVKPQLDLGRTPDPVQQPTLGQPEPNPTETQTAMIPPVPPPKPAPPKDQPGFHLSKPSGALNAPKTETRHEAPPHTARYAGPAATRDEYLAYLVALTRQHMDMMPLSFVGNRRGEAVISVTVYDNGGIGPLGVLRSSGYPDIDRRIEQMITAVGRFPPLPQWFQGNAVQLELTLRFPEALEER